MASKSPTEEIFNPSIIIAAMKAKDIVIPMESIGVKSQSDLDSETDDNLALKINSTLIDRGYPDVVEVVYGPNSNQNVIITRRINGDVVVRPRAIIK